VQDYTAPQRVATMKYKIALEKTDEGFSVKEYLLVRDDLIRDADVREVEVG
jgi:hypothetical protein